MGENLQDPMVVLDLCWRTAQTSWDFQPVSISSVWETSLYQTQSLLPNSTYPSGDVFIWRLMFALLTLDLILLYKFCVTMIITIFYKTQTYLSDWCTVLVYSVCVSALCHTWVLQKKHSGIPPVVHRLYLMLLYTACLPSDQELPT